MAVGMMRRKVTITIDTEQFQAVQRVVEAGAFPSVSAFVQHAITVAINDIVEWGTLLDQSLERRVDR
jgi:Arc/MetJ-type ribon-helix-helix transcriptional regulator